MMSFSTRPEHKISKQKAYSVFLYEFLTFDRQILIDKFIIFTVNFIICYTHFNLKIFSKSSKCSE